MKSLEEIQQIVNSEYRPVTVDQAIKMTYWAIINSIASDKDDSDTSSKNS